MNPAFKISEIPELSKTKSEMNSYFSSEALHKFDMLMGDDKLETENTDSVIHSTTDKIENKFNELFDDGNLCEKSDVNAYENGIKSDVKNADITAIGEQPDLSSKTTENSNSELNGNIYETDDNGEIYKQNDKLLPNTEYTINGNKYKTDKYGNKISCDCKPSYTENGIRNIKDQIESGGEERHEYDDGGHIIARILGGSEGEENLVPMRRTINRGDYKKMENEIAKNLQEGKNVDLHIDLEYEEDSKRPSKICAEYSVDSKSTFTEFDNQENSTELLNSLKDKISDEDYNNLNEEIEDMKSDGINATITSVKTEYDGDDKPIKITVGFLDESTGIKSYKVYEPKSEALL